MEPLPKERNHFLDVGGTNGGINLASMEPLPKERNHRCIKWGTEYKDREPQWSRSRRSGITIPVVGICGDAAEASMEPLPKERNHGLGFVCLKPVPLPQWSRSRRSGITRGGDPSVFGR